MESSMDVLVAADPLGAVQVRTLTAVVDSDTGEVNRNLARALEIVTRSPDYQKRFGSWLAENWHVWVSFEEQAEAVWKTGRVHYSARTIIEVLRHETVIREAANPRGFKINNSFVPDLGRLYSALHPLRAGFFECREFKGVAIRTAIRGDAANHDKHDKAA